MACDWTTERKRSCEKIEKVVVVVSGSRGCRKQSCRTYSSEL